jgi:hypothetical protein
VIPPDARDDYDDGFPRRREPLLTEESEQRGISPRTLGLVGIGVVGVLIAIVTAVLISQGGDDPVTADPVGDESSTRANGTVVVVGSATPPRPGAEASPSPGGRFSPVASPAPGGSATPTAEDGETPTDDDTPETPDDADPTPTRAPSASPTATPTATVPLPTATPTFPPTPTSTVQSHPVAYSDCGLDGNCGDPPLRVICPPDGTWFVDEGNNYNKPPDWPETTANTTREAAEKGQAGC